MTQFALKDAHVINASAVRYIFETADADAVRAAVHAFFAWRGYALEEGTAANGVYGKGSAVSRALLGGLATRFKFNVAVYAGDGITLVDFSKGMAGILGGGLGVTRMNNEFAAIQAELKAL